jgi:membrane-associated protease RseP (regulator of RpoE activity)
MRILSLRNAVSWALMTALVLGTGATLRANDDQKGDGKVVRIGRSDGKDGGVKLPTPDDGSADPGPRVELPKYWIGLLGGSIPEDDSLRAQLDLPENQGLRVESVVPDSPAAKAGLKRHDIMLKANEQDLHEMRDLVELVTTEGAKKGQITLEVLRHNKRETVYLTPEERPANAPVPQGGGIGGGNFGGGQFGLPQDFMQQFGDNFPMEFRNFGNGMVLGGGGAGFAGMPNGVSVSVQKEDGKPAQITVKRGDETWNLTDDPESLKQLPEDLRPFVDGMVHGNRGMQLHMPNFERGPGAGPGLGDGRLRERMERLEQRLEEMQKRLGDQPIDKQDLK